jgi:hypothetical protein
MLYLFADRDADAENLIERYIAKKTTLSDSARLDELNNVFGGLQNSRPIRVAMLDRVMNEMIRLSEGESPRIQLRVLNRQMVLMRALDDTVRAYQTAQRIVAIDEKLTATDRETEGFRVTRQFVANALDILADKALEDSLRKNTEAYVALRRAHLSKATRTKIRASAMKVGQSAPRLHADFWITPPGATIITSGISGPNSGASDNALVRPAPGKVSLVAFFNHECQRGPRRRNDVTCYGPYAVLRRLGNEFPTLEITLVAHTRGYMGELQPPTPAQEAEILGEWWLGFHRIPATVAVTQTSFWRLPGPDRRRIDNPVGNLTNYALGQPYTIIPNGMAVLVDEKGLIVTETPLHRNTERELRRLVGILMQRTQETQR